MWSIASSAVVRRILLHDDRTDEEETILSVYIIVSPGRLPFWAFQYFLCEPELLKFKGKVGRFTAAAAARRSIHHLCLEQQRRRRRRLPGKKM